MSKTKVNVTQAGHILELVIMPQQNLTFFSLRGKKKRITIKFLFTGWLLSPTQKVVFYKRLYFPVRIVFLFY